MINAIQKNILLNALKVSNGNAKKTLTLMVPEVNTDEYAEIKNALANRRIHKNKITASNIDKYL